MQLIHARSNNEYNFKTNDRQNTLELSI